MYSKKPMKKFLVLKKSHRELLTGIKRSFKSSESSVDVEGHCPKGYILKNPNLIGKRIASIVENQLDLLSKFSNSMEPVSTNRLF